MSNFLLYWKYFWDDFAENSDSLNELWYTAQKSFWEKVEPDDNLWVVIFGDSQSPNEWRLLQRIVVQKKFTDFKYDRPYRLIGDSAKGQHFNISSQDDLTPLLHSLNFVSGKKITATGRAIGNAIQTIRPLSEADGLLLEKYSQTLKINSSKSDTGNLLKDEIINAQSVLEPPERVIYEVSRIVRDTIKTRKLKKLYNYYCQLCNQRIEISPTKFYCEVHHIKPLGGEHQGLDVEQNMLVVCPTHHACFDLGVAEFVSNEKVKIGKDFFPLTIKHNFDKKNLDYHNNFWKKI